MTDLILAPPPPKDTRFTIFMEQPDVCFSKSTSSPRKMPREKYFPSDRRSRTWDFHKRLMN